LKPLRSCLRASWRRGTRALISGIVHIGVGKFHRAHQAVYLDDLFNAGVDRDWAIIGAGVREADVDMRAKLAVQDWLTTVVEQETSVSTARVTGAMIDFVKPFDVEAMLDMLARPQFRIVSLTVTEGGYYISPATQWFDPAHPDIVQDAHNPDAPKTAFGLIAAGLKRRRTADVAPFTVMSCDNIPGNWHVTENAVAGLAELSDPSSRNGSAPTSRSRIPWSTASLRRRPIGSARSCGTRTASRTLGRCSAKSSASGWWRTNSRRVGRRWRRRHLHLRRCSLRTDENPYPQRRTRGDRLYGRASRYPLRA
jgi:hypothetical protein